jgi:hypothetical protein
MMPAPTENPAHNVCSRSKDSILNGSWIGLL